MSSEEAALLRLLARSSRAELRGLRREGVLTEGVAGVEVSLSTSDLQIWGMTQVCKFFSRDSLTGSALILFRDVM